MTISVAVAGDDTQAIKRKERSERILASEGVPVNAALPLIKVSAGTRPRRCEEVAIRALCVLMVAIKAERMDQSMVLRVIRQYGLAAHFTPYEKEFIRNAEPTAEEKMALSASFEAATVLLWALGYLDALSIPSQTCDEKRAIACMRDRKRQWFINEAELRPVSQLLDQADLIFRYHWAMADAEKKKRKIPADLNVTVVNERLRALNWLVRYPDKEWDELLAGS